MSDVFDLGLEEYHFGVRVGDSVVNYVLRELDGESRDKYLNVIGDRVRIDKEGKPSGVKNFVGLQSELLERSIHRIDADGVEHSVSVGDLQKWPASVLDRLFKKARDLSRLDPESEELEGND